MPQFHAPSGFLTKLAQIGGGAGTHTCGCTLLSNQEHMPVKWCYMKMHGLVLAVGDLGAKAPAAGSKRVWG